MKIELRNISKTYGTTSALRDIHLELEEGQFLTLLGPTGCGKSTLLRIIAGFVEPSAGEVIVGGQVINNLPPNRRQIGLLFQNYALFPHMTVEQNVSFGLRVQGLSKAVIASKVDTVLPLLGIEHLRWRYPAQLSGGQQQRTALARTLAIEPRVLLLDEPLAALDRKLKLEMQVELKKLVTRLGITTICVSHDQDEALTMSDSVAVLNGGVIEQFGAPLEIYDRPKSHFTAGFLGRSNLLSGEIVSGPDHSLAFRAGELQISVPASDLPPGSSATLMVRPEHLLLEQTATPLSLPGTVNFVTQFGHSMQYEITLSGGEVFLVTIPRTRGMTPLPGGSHVFIRPSEPSAFRILPR